MLKRTLLIFTALLCSLAALAADGTLFTYPVIPSDMTDFGERTDYYVSHFWDACRFKTAFSSRQKFEETFYDFAPTLSQASANVALSSVDKLIENVSKTDPKNLLTLAQIAEEAFYDGKAGYVSDELYLPFAKAVASAKKLSSAEKARYARHARILDGSQPNKIAPDFAITLADGSKTRFSERKPIHTLLFINDPDCDDCRMARVRMAADYYVNQFIENGDLQIVSIYPGEYDTEWAQSVADYNDNWIVGASTEVEDLYDMRQSPTLYYLDKEGRIISQLNDVNVLLEGFYRIYVNQNNK